MWKIASGPQIIINFTFKFSAFVFLRKTGRENYVKEREMQFLTYSLRSLLDAISWGDVVF